MTLKKPEPDVIPQFVRSPKRISDVQAAVLWWLREHPEQFLTAGSHGSLRWNGWTADSHSPWGEVPSRVSETTGRALLRHRLIRPIQEARPISFSDQPVDSNVIPVDFHSKDAKPAVTLTTTLLDLAEKISGNRLKNKAHAMVIVLSGPNGHEVSHVGHLSTKELRQACETAGAYYYRTDDGPSFYGNGSPRMGISLEGRAALLHREKWDAIRHARERYDQRKAWDEECRITFRFSSLELDLNTEMSKMIREQG